MSPWLRNVLIVFVGSIALLCLVGILIGPHDTEREARLSTTYLICRGADGSAPDGVWYRDCMAKRGYRSWEIPR